MFNIFVCKRLGKLKEKVQGIKNTKAFGIFKKAISIGREGLASTVPFGSIINKMFLTCDENACYNNICYEEDDHFNETND